MNNDSESYDEQWSRLFDFIRYNPGARHRRRLIQRLIKKISKTNPSVIDVGCGLGFTVQSIEEVLPHARITGLDFSEVAINGARIRFPQHMWRVADVMELGNQDPADVVVCTEVIEHLPDWKSGLTSVLNLVVDNGYLIVTTQSGKVHQTERAVGHERHFDTLEISTLLEEHSFSIRHSQCWGWPGYVILKYLANVRSETTMEAFGSGHYGPFARLLNNVAYGFSGVFSIRNHRRGSQIVIVAQRCAT